MTDIGAPADVRERLCLALDVEDLSAALQLSRELQPWFGIAKVGLELFISAGPAAVESLVEQGYVVFLDLKLHDIPTTVRRAAARARAIGATYLTTHLSGGRAMVEAAVEGMGDGPGGVMGVTVLTSDAEAPVPLLTERTELAVAARCHGVICAAGDLPAVRAVGAGVVTIVPGIRLASSSDDDQQRAASPAQAIKNRASILVIGRTVTASDDRRAAAQQVAAEVRCAF